MRKLSTNDLKNVVNGEYKRPKSYSMLKSAKNEWGRHIDSLKEGEIWTDEKDKKWTKKNGVIMNIPKIDRAKLTKDGSLMPWSCPECGKPLKSRIDKKMWKIHKMCFDCVLKMETKLKAQGKFKEYERNFIKKNLISHLKDIRQQNKELLDGVDEEISFVENSSGEIQKWDVSKKQIEETRNKLKDAIKEIDEQLEELENI